MTPLTSFEQIDIGTKLKIIGFNPRDNYQSVSIKLLTKAIFDNDYNVEVIINRKKNRYFNLDLYLAGKSSWVKEAFVLQGKDERLKIVKDNGWCKNRYHPFKEDQKFEATIRHDNSKLKLKDEVVILRPTSDGFYLGDSHDELSYNWSIIKWRKIQA